MSNKSNEDIVKEYTQKISKEKKSANQKLFKICSLILIISVIVIFSPVAVTVINSNIERSKERIVPNLKGKTFAEAQKELADIDLMIKANNENPDAIIMSQNTSYKMKKGETVEVLTKTQEEIDKEKEEQKKKDEESGKIWRACSKYAKTVEAYHEGSVNYYYPSNYGETEKSGKVYQLKYKTNDEHIYYYQLVSFNKDYTEVIKSTKLFRFSDYGGKETGQTQELEYAYKNTF